MFRALHLCAQLFATVLAVPADGARARAEDAGPPADGAGAGESGAGEGIALRRRLAARGVAIESRYVSELAWNPAGGRRETITETGEFDIGARIDLRRLAGIDGTVQATITWRRGQQLDDQAGLGTLQEVQEIYGRGHAWRLTRLWYERELAGGAMAIKAGRTAPSEDFAAFSCLFQNLAFCGSQPGNLVGDYWYNWPISQWGGRLKFNHRSGYAQIAIYEENPRNLHRGFTLGHVRGATGALIPAELAFRHGGRDGGAVGTIRLGGWLSTADAPDLFLDDRREPIILTGRPALQRGAAHGAWIGIQQQLSGRSRHGAPVSGVGLFLNATLADRRTAPLDNQIVAGLFARGLPWARRDMVGIGFVRTHVNARLARADRLAGRPVRHAEYAAELFYGAQPAQWLTVRPNLQWIHHAGGLSGARDILVVGFKTEMRL